jgi:hypothetical protein
MTKLKNVVENSIPADQRAIAGPKVNELNSAFLSFTSSLEKLENVTRHNLSPQYRDQVQSKIDALKQALANDLGGADSQAPDDHHRSGRTSDKGLGFYCAAGCTDVFGKVEMNLLGGSSGTNQLVAKQGATDSLNKYLQAKSLTCQFGTGYAGCEQETPKEVTCQAACGDVFGKPDSGYTAIGQGNSQLEAQVKAIRNLREKYNCSYKVVIAACQ